MKYLKEYTEDELKELARKLSGQVYTREPKTWLRLYETTSDEMSKLVYGALLSLRWNHANPDCVQGILDYAEFMFNIAFPQYEGYNSIYGPLMITVNTDAEEILIDEDALSKWLKNHEPEMREALKCAPPAQHPHKAE